MRADRKMGMRRLAALLLLLAGAAALAACYPKSQVYGVGNEGGLVFDVNPPDAEVVIDGVVQGKAGDFTYDRYLKVAAGTHKLELRAPGYDTYGREIYVSNTLLRIDVGLVKK